MSDEEIIEAVEKVHPYSTALVELLNEAWRRQLAEVLPAARKYSDHPDPFVDGSAIKLICYFGDASDVPALVGQVDRAYDHYHLAAILEAIVTLDHARVDYVSEIANRERDDEYFDNDYVIASLVALLSEVLPDDSPDLEENLLDWATDSRLSLTQRPTVYRRLAKMPRTQRLEDFFVDFCVKDEGADPQLTEIVDDALRSD